MTRKLTDEQVKAIREMAYGDLIEIPMNNQVNLKLYKNHSSIGDFEFWQVKKLFFDGVYHEKYIEFKTADEAIAYAEHLLNQRYYWLPQQQAWIMSGEVYNFANNGANKVWELIALAEASYEFGRGAKWYANGGGNLTWFTGDRLDDYDTPSPEAFKEGITIPAESPIWDAVKGVE